MHTVVSQERETYCKFQDVWRDLSRIRPNLLGEPRKKTTQVEDADDGVQEERPISPPSTQRRKKTSQVEGADDGVGGIAVEYYAKGRF
jgi:hypothetical protein